MIGDVVEFQTVEDTCTSGKSDLCRWFDRNERIGASVASAVMTGLLSMGGYISTAAGSVTQPDSALHMIVNIYKGGPLIVAGGVLVVLLFYHLDKQYPDIMKELIEREAKGEL